jgi:hypothetical protein
MTLTEEISVDNPLTAAQEMVSHEFGQAERRVSDASQKAAEKAYDGDFVSWMKWNASDAIAAEFSLNRWTAVKHHIDQTDDPDQIVGVLTGLADKMEEQVLQAARMQATGNGPLQTLTEGIERQVAAYVAQQLRHFLVCWSG